MTWLPVPPDSDFPLQNIPFGVIRTADERLPRAATRIGDTVIDLYRLAKLGFFGKFDFDKEVLHEPTLNPFIALGKDVTTAFRKRVIEIFADGNNELSRNEEFCAQICIPVSKVEMLLPIQIGDYTDFYSSREHATNVGTMFRDPQNALLPNWLHLPVGYHGRSSSIVVSGTPVRRPKGQTEPQEGAPNAGFGPCKQLDFELEMAFVIGKDTQLGQSVSTAEANDYIFGMMLFNDWSARDIQKWEYVPLGPFLAKNFASSLSPWIVTMEALEPFRVPAPAQEPKPLPYLQCPDGGHGYDLHLEVAICPENGGEKVVSNSNYKYMYWTMAQQLAHHTVNGCNIRVGDLMASGTISGPTPDSYGSMLEIAWKGTKPVPMPDGTERRFILDGDTVIMRGYGIKNGVRIGFGEVTGKVLPAIG